MAKKRKKTKSIKLSGLRDSKPFITSALHATNTPVGRILIAEALILAAGVLTRKHPVATVSAAGAEAANTTRSVASSAGEVAASLMQAAADRLRSGNRGGGSRGDSENQQAGRNGAWEHLDRGAIRQAIMGEFTRRKNGKKGKAARRH